MAARKVRIHPLIAHLTDPSVGSQQDRLDFMGSTGTVEGHHVFRDVNSLEACLLEDLGQRCEEALDNGMDIEVIRLALRQYAATIVLMVVKD